MNNVVLIFNVNIRSPKGHQNRENGTGSPQAETRENVAAPVDAGPQANDFTALLTTLTSEMSSLAKAVKGYNEHDNSDYSSNYHEMVGDEDDC